MLPFNLLGCRHRCLCRRPRSRQQQKAARNTCKGSESGRSSVRTHERPAHKTRPHTQLSPSSLGVRRLFLRCAIRAQWSSSRTAAACRAQNNSGFGAEVSLRGVTRLIVMQCHRGPLPIANRHHAQTVCTHRLEAGLHCRRRVVEAQAESECSCCYRSCACSDECV